MIRRSTYKVTPTRNNRPATHSIFPGVVTALMMGVCLVFSSSCRMPRAAGQPDPSPAAGITKELAPGTEKAKAFDESPLVVNEIAPKRSDSDDEWGLPEISTGQIEPDGPVHAYPGELAPEIKKPDAMLAVQLNLDSAPVQDIVPMFGKLLGFNYLIDEAVNGTVTMKIDSEMTAREVWKLFDHILWLTGAYPSRNDGAIHIMPLAEMARERDLLAEKSERPNVSVRIVRLNYIKKKKMAALLGPFVTPGATITDLERLNSLLIVEAPANLPKLLKLIDVIDRKAAAGWPRALIRCQEADAEVIAAELNELLPVLGFAVAAEMPSGGEIKLIPLPRLQVIVVSAALEEVLEEIKRWVKALDRQNAAEQENIYFYNVRHGRADQLADALSTFFSEISTIATGTAQPDSKAVSSQAAKPKSAPRKSGGASAPDSKVRPGIFETPVSIHADGRQNRLTIRTTKRTYAMVETLLKRLDTPPRQVVIQAVVADITLTENTEYGFSYAAMQQYGDYVFKHAMLGAPAPDNANFPEPKTFPNGIAFLLKKDEDKMAFIRAVAGDNNVKVLSSPQIMATSDQQARINVGSRVPIVTADFTDLESEDGTLQRNIEYVDTGVILTVTPYITAGNEVTLDVVQEVSDATENKSSGIDSPTIRSRELQTTMVIPDGQTALLGGLIRTQEEEGYAGVPLLMDIPYLGVLFRNNSWDKTRTEIVVLITVNVVNRETKLESLVRRYENALREIQEKMGDE